MDDIQVKTVLNGATKLALLALKHPKHEPFTLVLIGMLFSQLDPTDLLDTSMRACLITSFFMLAHTSEFTAPSLDSFDPAPTSNALMFMPQWIVNHITVFRLPCTKSSRDSEDVYCAAHLPHLGIGESPLGE